MNDQEPAARSSSRSWRWAPDWPAPAPPRPPPALRPRWVGVASGCTDLAAPCTLLVALGAAQAGDTLSLAGGLQPRAGHPPARAAALGAHRPADPAGPHLALAAPTLDLTAAQSGTSLQGLEVDNTNPGQFQNPQSFPPALRVGSGVAATVRSASSPADPLRRGLRFGAADHRGLDALHATISFCAC